MKISEFQQLYGSSPQAVALVKALDDASVGSVFLQGLLASSAPVLFATVAPQLHNTFLFVLDDADTAGYFYHDLTQVMGTDNVLYFPSSYRRAIKYGQKDEANEVLRTETLTRLADRHARTGASSLPLFIVSSPEGVAQLVVEKRQLDARRITLTIGQTVDITDLEKQLRALGFRQEDYVYEPGQFAVRGSILDVYSFSSEYPFRIDFFGDDIDTIRTFEVQDQLSKERKTTVEIVAELTVGDGDRQPFLQFLPSDAVLVTKDYAFLRDTIARIYDEGFTSQAVADRLEGATEVEREGIMHELTKDNLIVKPSLFDDDAARLKLVEFGPMPRGVEVRGRDGGAGRGTATIKYDISPQPLFHKNFDLLRRSLDDYRLQGYRVCILADSKKQQERLREILAEQPSSTNGRGSASSSQPGGAAEDDSLLVFVDGTLHEGFADNVLRVCFFTDHQIFDRFHKYSLKSDAARQGKMALTMKELQELEVGDYLVHVDFGVGKFGGLVRVPVPSAAGSGSSGAYQEVIRIVYKNNDKVDVSIHSLYKISKYRSGETGEPPRLSTLGTGAWERLKERAKKKIKDIARDLIKLYAKRRHEKGFAYSADTFMQRELEASFHYEDTPDQLKTTQDVKADMESPRPMDRLVCGDVGFGKTEVAVRAAFKAACDGKQTAVLVPTTVLAWQHYQTFSSRLKDFPVRVDYLSRARTAKQTREVLADLEAGKIDILIGTHKLIGKQVKWHDLGLLIIDEEQKFGVAVKEKLRQFKTNVDTLTMTATPIPRTLQFSLMGARDMSVIRTPPPNRYPIYTELTTFSHEVIADAINFEMSRGGQAFVVSNRINSLPEIAALIHKYVPDCRVAIGHGQMNPDELEKIVMGFMNYDYDVLLSTTIVENGIDIPNANTIIINDAQRFGLSDLHQMRGRVGRGNRKAFCYLLAPPKSLLKADARRRLEALESFSELGSGFNLAMQDLDIRGAGNLLGAEQSGFMEDLGYETYQKILNQAVTELKNDEFGALYAEEMAQGKDVTGDEFVDDCAVESDLPMYFPDTYVPGDSERMLLYRELDNITSDDDLDAYRRRLVDRFGPVPKEGEELMQVVSLRRIGRSLGCERIVLRKGRLGLQFVSNPDSAYYQSKTFGRVLDFVAANARRCDLAETRGRRMMHVANVHSVGEAVALLRQI